MLKRIGAGLGQTYIPPGTNMELSTQAVGQHDLYPSDRGLSIQLPTMNNPVISLYNGHEVIGKQFQT